MFILNFFSIQKTNLLENFIEIKSVMAEFVEKISNVW